MAVSTDTLLARIAALEKRVTALAAKVKTDETTLAPLYSMSSPNRAALGALILPTPHQTTSNANISASAGPLSATDRTAVNGVINAVNNWQAGAQNANIEA